MDTWTLELTLKRNGREDLDNVKHVRMDGLSTQAQNISLRRIVGRMAEDFVSFLNKENDYVPRCGSCGGELVRRLLGDEYYLYCSECEIGETDG